MSQPGVKKNKDGTWTITGVQERTITQQQADYEDLVKASRLIPGQEGVNARQLILDNPGMSGGLLASLSKNYAIPNNDLVKTLVDIDSMTQAQREQNAFLEAQRIANEKFDKTVRGKVWKYVKGFTRFGTLALETPFELLGAGVRTLKQSFDAYSSGDIDFWTGQPTDPNKTREEAGYLTGAVFGGRDASAPKAIVDQTKAGQIGRAIAEGKAIDFGQGFFASEETGLGFAARQAKLESAKIVVKLDDRRTYERPYSFFDPVIEFIPFIEPDSGKGSLVSAIGDLVVLIMSDPGIAYTRAKMIKDQLERTARLSSGMKAATTARDLALKEAELEELVKQTNEAIEAWRSSSGFGRLAREEEVADAIKKQMQVADEYDNIVYDPEAIAKFLSGSNGAPIVDSLAGMGFKEIYGLGKQRGARGAFSVQQAKELAAATTREEVLGVLAKYIAQGEVVADVLETGTKVGNAIRGLANSRIVPGKATQVVNSVKGLGARGVAKLPFIGNVMSTVSKNYATILPGGSLVHASDKDALVSSIYNYGRATNVPENIIDDLVNTVVYADDASAVGYAATGRLFDEIFKANAGKKGIDAEALKEATRLFENGREEMASYWAARHADGTNIDYIFGNGKKKTISGPHLDSEYLNSMVYLPPADDILNIISRINSLPVIGKSTKELRKMANTLTSNYWKKMVLVRPAYILRNIAEEQIRVLGTGHISFFNNPVTAMAMWLGNEASSNPMRKLLAAFNPYKNTLMGPGMKLGDAVDEFGLEVLAHDAKESYVAFMANNSVTSFDRDVKSVMKFAGFMPVKYRHPRWFEGLANEIRILSNSISGRVVARTALGKEQAGVDYVLRGAGKKEWEEFANGQPKDVREWLLTDEGAMNYLFTGKNAKGQLTSVRARVDEAAGMDGEAAQAIKNLIAFGKIQSESFNIIVPKGLQSAENSIRNAEEIAKGKKALADANQEFASALKNAFNDKGNWENLEMNVPIAKFAKKGKEEEGRINRFIESFFDISISLEKSSTMGPEWLQKYWDTVLDIAGSLDAAAVAQLKVVAEKSLTPLKSWKGQPIGKQHQVWKAFEQTKEGGNVTAQMAHEYASTVASRHVAELFYDASKKRLLFHQFRLILPFGQAWQNTINAWSNIALNNPMQLYKINKGLQWLTKPESSAMYQLTDARDYYDPNQGFFYTDPLDGQRKFFVPFLATGMNFMTNLVFGRAAVSGPYAAAATPQSFNFAFASGSIIPGVGPGLTIPLSALDKAGVQPLQLLTPTLRDMAYKFIFPFGSPDFETGFIEGFLPGNWRRILAPVSPEEGYAAAFAPTMNYLASSGGYDLDDMEDQAKLIKDADFFAKFFTLFRGIIGLVSPFPINPTGLTTLEDGNTLLTTALYNDFKQLEAASGGDRAKAYRDFFDLYGPNYAFAIIATSTGAPTNLYTYELVKENPEVVDIYPDVYGYAYPGGGYSTELYRWQRRMGNKERFSTEELMQRATMLRYNAAKDTLLARSVGENWESDQFDESSRNLTESFVGAGLKYDADPYRNKRIKEQLKRMALDESFDDSDAVQGLRDYLYLREQAVEASGNKSDSLANKASLPQRQWLAERAKEIIARHPDFMNMYYAFFKRELEAK